MTEEIVRALAEIAGISPTLRLGTKGGASIYPESASVVTGLAGKTSALLKLRVRFKGDEPSMLFYEAERVYGLFSGDRCAKELQKRGITVFSVSSEPPKLESCDSCGLYTVSFAASVTYPCPAGAGDTPQGTDKPSSDIPSDVIIEYDGGEGLIISSAGTDIRIADVEGTEPFTSVYAEENAFFSGAEYIGSRARSRKLTLYAAVSGTGTELRRKLYRVFRTGNEGTLTFYAGNSVRKIGCRTEKITAEIKNGAQIFKIALICTAPYFENGSSARFPICGTTDMWEFDGWELPEEEEFEFSSIINRSSAVVENNGDVPAGCVITVTVDRAEASGITLRNSGRKTLGVSGVFAAGDTVIFDTRDGQKGIFLVKRSATQEKRDITGRIVHGSEFFSVPPGTDKLHISAEGGLDGISAEVRFTERFEGI